MVNRAARWLAVSLVLCSCQIVPNNTKKTASWPNCPKQSSSTNPSEVKQGQTNPDVTQLLLKQCNITEISTDITNCYPNLRILDLSYNNIDDINSGTFDNLTALEHLNLKINRFAGKELPPKLLSNCRQLREIEFSYNDMADTPENLLQGLENLEKIVLINSSLYTIPPFAVRPAFKNLKTLNFRVNRILRLEDPTTFVNVPNIETLSLSLNKIDYLHKDIFKPLNKIKYLYMHTNKLSFIPEELFLNKSSLLYVELSYNRIEYVPLNALLGTSVRELYLRSNRITYLPDNFFTQLQKHGGQLQTMYIGKNPLQCGCLNEIIIELKKIPVKYYNDGRLYKYSPYDGKRPACVILDNFKCLRTDAFARIYDDLVDNGKYNL